MTVLASKAQTLRELHRPGDPIVLANAWDASTARAVAAAVDVPVTADLEAGYGLSAAELVERMRSAGAVGLNFEDTDHDAPGPRELVDAEEQAAKVAALRDASRAADHDIVINARMDPYLLGMDDALDESLRRARLYLEAGADSLFPAGIKDEADIERFTSELDAPVNVLLIPGVPDIPRLAELRVGRVSVGGGLAKAALAFHAGKLAGLREGKSYW
jgi:2-methylisocitrate lyase-like PEP mutase family enzyme